MNPIEFTSWHRQIARLFRTASEYYRIEILWQAFCRYIYTNMAITAEFNSLGAHLSHTTVNNFFVEFKIGNTITQQTAYLIFLFK